MTWTTPRISNEEIDVFTGQFAVDNLSARLLLGRNITRPDDLKFFLDDDLRILHNPFLFSQMDIAVDRIRQAIDEEEKVLVFGDRDVDGITSTALMVEELRQRGLEVLWEVPMGDDHYGLQTSTIDRGLASDVTLFITVDCGIGNIAEVDYAASMGADCIVIDHHNPGDELPNASAIINPKCEEQYPFEGLSAVALVSKLCTALDIADSDFYNQTFCLLNLRPGNDSIIVEAVKLHNLTEQSRITETFVSGAGEQQLIRVIDYIRDQIILVYQKDYQMKLLGQLFGGGIDISLSDIAPQVWEAFPPLRGRSLLRMLQGSRLNRFSSVVRQEIDAGVQLLISLLYKRNPDILKRMQLRLDLVAMGLIADMMPLENENRVLVKQGLASLSKTQRPGLRELLARLNLLGKDLTSTNVGWRITPSINATGRMGTPDIAVRLLLEEGNPSELADRIFALNEERKQLGTEAWSRALPQAEQAGDTYDGKLVVVQDAEIHRGITGILAGRLARHFDKPAMVIASIDGHFVGSVRSARGFHVTDFLSMVSQELEDFGGHDAAGGFYLTSDRLEAFLALVDEKIRYIELDECSDATKPHADLELAHPEFTEELETFQKKFEPVGMDFAPIRYSCRKLVLQQAQTMGKDGVHLRMLLSSGSRKWPAVYWSAAERLGRDFSQGTAVDCMFTLERNYFGANSNLQLNIIEMEPHV